MGSQISRYLRAQKYTENNKKKNILGYALARKLGHLVDPHFRGSVPSLKWFSGLSNMQN